MSNALTFHNKVLKIKESKIYTDDNDYHIENFNFQS